MKAVAKSFNDDYIRNNFVDNAVVSGGCISSMLRNEEVNDFDVYFKTKDFATRVICALLPAAEKNNDSNKVSKIEVRQTEDGVRIFIKSSGIIGTENSDSNYEYFEISGNSAKEFLAAAKEDNPDNKDYYPVYFTDNSVTLKNNVQLVTRFVGEAEEIHKNYDFQHCMVYWTKKTGVVLNEKSLLCMMDSRLEYSGSRFPICSLFRLRKFISRGWRISAGEMMKIAWDISKLDLDNIEVLEDQMMGVDHAYFREVIDVLKTNRKELDRTYLFELLDAVWNDEMDTDVSDNA
jgi:hypothetical protein